MPISLFIVKGPPWPWSYCSWTLNCLCNQCLLPLMLWVRISIRARCTTLCDKVCQWLGTGRWFSPGAPVSSTPWYNWNIAESGIKHHQSNKQTNILTLYSFPWNKSSSLNSYVSQRRNNAVMVASMSFWLGHPFKCFWIIPRVKLKSETLWHA